jgi:hypothetical protein
MNAPGERKLAFVLLLLVAKKYARLLFGVELEIDYGESDHADAFVRGYQEVFPNIENMLCYFHVTQTWKHLTQGVYLKIKDGLQGNSWSRH